MNAQRRISEITHFYPKQQEAKDAAWRYEYVLFGGAAGPGKSYLLRWFCILFLLHAFKRLGLRNVRVGLFCEDYPSLEDRHLSKVRSDFPEWLGTLNEGRREFKLAPKWGGGIIAFRNLDKPGKYQSVEFAAIAVDELTKNARIVFDELRARKRWPGIEFSPFLAASNPGSIGHAWVKKLWIDRDFTGEEDAALDPERFKYIPAKADDNPALPASYHALLDSLPPLLRQAFRDGNWDLFVGQFFREWRRGHHTCAPFPIPKHWTTRRAAVDFGYGAPFSCHFYVRDEDAAKKGIQRWYAYRELYGADIRDEDQAKLVAKALQSDLAVPVGEPSPNFIVLADPSMWNRKPMQSVSIADVYAQQGVPLTKANNDRVPGWQRVRAYLADASDGKPHIIYFDTCPAAIRTIPSLVHDSINVEDLDTKAEDHAADELRYFVMHAGVPEQIDQRVPYQLGGAKPSDDWNPFGQPKPTIVRRTW